MDAADAAFDQALAADPRHVATLLRRRSSQRRRPDRRLVDTLTRLAAEQPDNLDFLREAAEIASTALADETLAIELLGRLCDRAGNLLARGARAAGRMAAADVAAYAVDETVRLHVASGTPGAVEPGDRAAARRRPAAAVRRAALGLAAAGRGADRKRARRQARRDPDLAAAARAGARRRGRARGARASLRDRRPLRRRASRCGSPSSIAADDQERRLALRLEIVRLGGLLEQRSNAPEVLRASLGERPGHGPTLRKLAEVLVAKGRQAELADVLEGPGPDPGGRRGADGVGGAVGGGGAPRSKARSRTPAGR